MAAGLSLPEENVEEFRRRINEECSLTEEELTEVIRIDIALPFSHVSEKVVEELELLEPFGNGNGKPVFAARNVQVLEYRIMGKNQNALRMKLKDESGAVLEGICFNDQMRAVLALLEQKQTMHMLYYPELNEYRGVKRLQVQVRNCL